MYHRIWSLDVFPLLFFFPLSSLFEYRNSTIYCNRRMSQSIHILSYSLWLYTFRISFAIWLPIEYQGVSALLYLGHYNRCISSLVISSPTFFRDTCLFQSFSQPNSPLAPLCYHQLTNSHTVPMAFKPITTG